MAGWGVLQGTLALAWSAVYAGGLAREMPETELRALAFVSLVLVNTSLILVNRSFSGSLLAVLARPNASLWILLSGVAALLAIALTWPPAAEIFRFGPLHLDDLGLSVLAGMAILVVLELPAVLAPGFRS
jgi:Ca2+-transporting ATPase